MEMFKENRTLILKFFCSSRNTTDLHWYCWMCLIELTVCSFWNSLEISQKNSQTRNHLHRMGSPIIPLLRSWLLSQETSGAASITISCWFLRVKGHTTPHCSKTDLKKEHRSCPHRPVIILSVLRPPLAILMLPSGRLSGTPNLNFMWTISCDTLSCLFSLIQEIFHIYECQPRKGGKTEKQRPLFRISEWQFQEGAQIPV